MAAELVPKISEHSLYSRVRMPLVGAAPGAAHGDLSTALTPDPNPDL